MNSKDKKEASLILWNRIKSNDDKAAFDRFYLLYAKSVFKYGFSLYQDEAYIYDCIQELFLNLWLKRKNIQFNSSPKSYLLVSLRRLILKNKSKVTFEDLGTISTITIEKEEKDSSAKDINKVKEIIETLPKRQKEAIYLKYIENLDYEEVSSVMGISIPSTYKAVSAAIKKIRSHLTSLFF